MDEVTHTALGWTRSAAWPAGFRPVRYRIRVGEGLPAFHRLAEGILTFDLHRRAGLRITGAQRAAVGSRVTVGFGFRALRLNAPCEVVWVQERYDGGAHLPGAPRRAGFGYATLPGAPRRAGFGYATLPGHPVSGEESFIAEITADGSVYFDLRAYSRHATLLYRLGAPVGRACQELVTRRYLTAARRIAAGKAPAGTGRPGVPFQA